MSLSFLSLKSRMRMVWILLLDFLFLIRHLNFQGVFLSVRGIAPAGAVILMKTVSVLFLLIAVDQKSQLCYFFLWTDIELCRLLLQLPVYVAILSYCLFFIRQRSTTRARLVCHTNKKSETVRDVHFLVQQLKPVFCDVMHAFTIHDTDDCHTRVCIYLPACMLVFMHVWNKFYHQFNVFIDVL